MATRIKLKRSLTPNSAPTTSDLQDKEVALNITDRTLFVNNNGNIQEVLNADPNDETIVPSMFSSAITNGTGNTWYVSKNGTDKATLGSVNPRHGSTTGSNAWGKTPMTAFASLKYCLDNYAIDGDTVIVSSGTYTETFPLTVPVGVSIKGAGFKTTFIKPTVGTNNKDAFLIQGNCNIEDIAVTDFYYDSANNTGYAFRTKSGYTVSTSGRRPYVQRCSVITKGSVTSGSDPRGYAQGDAGRGVLIDGGVVASNSAEASILFNECTFIVPNSVGLYLKNGARCEWLNSFTYFAADSVIGENPGGTGFAGQGRARLKLNGMTGTFAAGNTITQYASDGITAIASGTINQNDGTYIYLTGQGTGNFVEALESSLTAKQVIVNGDAQIDTAIKKIGNSSLKLDGTGDYLSLASSSDFGYGTGNFTIEFWVRRNSTGNQIIIDQRTASDLNKPVVHIEGGVFKFFALGNNRITGTTTVGINTWYHVAVVKNNNSTKLYVNGTQEGSTYTDNNDYGSTSEIVIGARFSGTDALPGYLDEVRISKGISRYTGTFTPSTTAFTTDINTSLLLQFEGLDGSTEIIDGGIASQDIRTSAGGTANFVTLADYTAFGAELRSIGSASIYGERGLTANGKGVRLYCITHNFSYIGTGKNQDNDISQVNQANEVIEINNGRALFTSVDQNGDFRVGNTFIVDQERGTVSFAGSGGTGTTFDQLTVTGSGNVTTILPTSISVGNLEFSGSSIESSVSSLTLDSSDYTYISSNRVLIEDGSTLSPSLAFWNDQDTGLLRGTDGNLKVVSDGSTIVSYEPERLKVSKNIEFDANRITNVSVQNSGNYYPVTIQGGTGSNTFAVPVNGGTGTDATLSATVSPFLATVATYGTYTTYGTFNVSLTGGSGTGGTGTVTIRGINGGTLSNQGSGYGTSSVQNYNFTNVTVTGGSGSGAIAQVIIANRQIQSVTFTSHGTGYQAGNVLSFDYTTMVGTDPSSGAPFTSQQPTVPATYVVPANPYGVISLVPGATWTGKNYIVGDVVGFSGGSTSGSGGTFTLNKVGYVSNIQVFGQQTGFSYEVGDIVSPTISFGSQESVNGIVETITLDVSGTNKNFVVFSNLSGTLTVGNTITFSGGATATIESTSQTRIFISTPSSAVSASQTFTTSGGATGTVSSTGQNYVFTIDDPETGSPKVLSNLVLKQNRVYNFVQSETDYNTYPLRFSTTPDGTNGGGSPYTTLVRDLVPTISGFGSQLIATSQTPTLYYYTPSTANAGGFDGEERTVTISTATKDIPTGASFLVNTITSGAQSIKIEPDGNITATGDTTLNNLTVTGTANIPQVNVTSQTSFSGAATQITSTSTTITSDLNINNGTIFVHNPENKVSFKSSSLPQKDIFFNGSVETYLDTFLASSESSRVQIGDLTDATEKLEVQDNVRVRGNIIASNGAINNPSYTFNLDNTVGFYIAPDTVSTNSLVLNNRTGNVAKFNTDDINFYRNLYFTNSLINEFEFIKGIGYTNGTYNDVPLDGGSGGGLTANLIVAFDSIVTNPGAGYDTAEYVDIPVSYHTLPGGAIQTVGSLTGGSNYVNGTYTNVPLTGGTGISATANITISGGAVTAATINKKGTDYSVNDVLSANVSNLGGSKLSTISLTNGGSNYQEGVYTNVPLTLGTGSGTGALATLTVNRLGSISNVQITGNGSQYTVGSTLSASISTTGTLTLNVTQPGGAGTTFFLGGVNRTSSALQLVVGNVYTFDNSSANEPFVISSSTSSTNALGSGDGVVYRLDGSVVTYSAYVSGFNAATTKTVTYTVPSSITSSNPVPTHYYLGAQSGSSIGGSIQYNNQSTGTGAIFTVTGVTSGSGFSLTVNTIGQALAGQAGTGAKVNIEVVGGVVDKLYVVDPGQGYKSGHLLTVANADMQYDQGGQLATSNPPTTQLRFTAGENGVVTFVEIEDSGFGYIQGDELSLDAIPGSGLDNGSAGVFDITSFAVSNLDSPFGVSLNANGYVLLLTGDGHPSPASYGVYPSDNNSFRVNDQVINEAFAIRVGENTQASVPQSIYNNSRNGYFANGVPFHSPSVGNTILDETSNGASTLSAPTGFNWNVGYSTVASTVDIDSAGGFPKVGNKYQYSLPRFLKNNTWASVASGNTYYSSSNYSGDYFRHANGHSKIIGIAADGYPVYGPFGYTTANNASSGISRQTSGYTLKPTDAHRPSGFKYNNSIAQAGPDASLAIPAGIFVEDYQFTNAGTLDTNNGRYCVTPEYPNGTYAYFVTFDNDNLAIANPVYPYIIGNTFKQLPTPEGTLSTDVRTTKNPNTLDESNFLLTLTSVTLEDKVRIEQDTGKITFKEGKLTGSLNFNDALVITNSTLTAPSDITLTSTNGSILISGNGAFKIPAGTTAQRPGGALPGAIRFNTTESRFEGFNGQYFVSLGGVRDVDGNTYISAELNPGDDDNTLRFVNDGTQSMQVEENAITLQTVNSIITTNIDGIAQWEANATVTAATGNQPTVYIYYGTNVYTVVQSGTFNTTPPTNTTGNTFTSGTAQLQYSRSIYGGLTFVNPGENITFNSGKLILGSSVLEFSSSGNAARISTFSSDGFIFTLTGSYREFIKLGTNGEFFVNNLYGQNIASNYIKLFDKDLRKFDLKDTRILSGIANIDVSSGNTSSIVLFPYTQSYSGKVMIEISDNSAISKRQYSELSYLITSNGSDVIYTETNKIYTDMVLCDVEIELDGSNNVAVKVTDVTNTSSRTYSIKVVSHTILA